WNVTSARYGPDHFIEGMAERWEQINLEVDDLNSVIPAVIMKDIERDWVYNAVVNVEEVIVYAVESNEPRADGGNPPIPEMDFRGGIPRLAMMCARDVNDLMKFVEVAEGETSGEDDVRMMKASPENIYTPNLEDIVSK
ncbi:GIP, partial [Symbiodinium microadriaticum]